MKTLHCLATTAAWEKAEIKRADWLFMVQGKYVHKSESLTCPVIYRLSSEKLIKYRVNVW